MIRKEGVEDCKRILKLESEGKKTIRKVRLYKKPKFDETAKDFRKMFKEKIDAILGGTLRKEWIPVAKVSACLHDNWYY